MLKIGDFSKLSQVSVQALRHYDDLGLLKPSEVDRFTGYRYYTYQQLHRLNRILALKDLGLSLEEIARLLKDGDLPASQLRGMLRMKQAAIEQRVSEEQERLARVEARLRQIETEDTMPNVDVIIKKLEPQLVASLRAIIPTYQHVGVLYGELYGYLAQHNSSGIAAVSFHDEGYKEKDVDAEALIYLKAPVPSTDRIKVYELPAVTVASTIHNGSYQTLNKSYDGLAVWVSENGYRIIGPNREVYLYVTQPVRQDDETYVTELQFPVEKA
jgi:effector-binding domain-containing protein